MSAKTKTSSSKMASGHLGGLKFLEEGRIPIRILTVCQIRKKPVDPQVVERYRDLLAESEPPPIVVTRDAQGHNYVADGHHRVAAAMAAGRTHVQARVYAGNSHDAWLAGLEANQHGLGLTLAEKRSALDALLDNGGRMYTDSGLARLTGLDRHTVERRRRERENGDFVATIRQPKTREEKAMAAAQGIARAIERQGVEALAQALGLLPAHIREDALQAVAGYREAGI